MVTLRKVRRDAPWAWLQAGMADFRRAPRVCLAYGLIFALVGLAISAGLWSIGWTSTIPVALSGFALVAPGLAVGLYQVSRAIEKGEKPRFRVVVSRFPGRLAQLALLSLVLLLLLLAWVRAAQFLLVVLEPGASLDAGLFLNRLLTTSDGLTLLVIGTLIGGVIAGCAFAMSALAFPMLVDRDVDAVTAIVASIKAVLTQPFVMFTWAWLIAAMTLAGAVVFVIGLAFTFPLAALASWHAYRDFSPEPSSSSAAEPLET